jgi:type IV secretion system protein VirD4
MRGDPEDSRGSGLAVGIVLGVVVAFGGLLWCATGIAALVSGLGWPALTASQVASALAKLPAHLADPRLAWPRAVRPRIAGPAAFYAAVVLIVALGAAVVAALVRLRVAQAIGGAADRERRGARWGSGSDVAVLREHRSRWRARGRQRDGDDARLALGHHGRRLLRAEARHALVVFGPPQSGKSAAIAIPALLEWDGPVVARPICTRRLCAAARSSAR